MSDDRDTLEDRIRERAYHLWMEAGCPAGRDQEFWFLARDAETGSLTWSSGGPTPAEEQLMAERDGPDVQSGPDSTAEPGETSLKDQTDDDTARVTPGATGGRVRTSPAAGG